MLTWKKISNDVNKRMIYSHEMTKEGIAVALGGEAGELSELTDAFYSIALNNKINKHVGNVLNLTKKSGRGVNPDRKYDFPKLIGSEIVDIVWYSSLEVDHWKINFEDAWNRKCYENDVKYGRIEA